MVLPISNILAAVTPIRAVVHGITLTTVGTSSSMCQAVMVLRC